MSEKPIVLEQILGFRGYDVQFTTVKSIADKELLRFYADITNVLIQLDPQINDVGEDYVNFFSGLDWPFSKLFKIRDLEKSLRVENGADVVRYHSIDYRRNPKGLSKEDIEFVKDNMFKHVLDVIPNIKLHSSKPTYDVNELVSSINDFGYVDTSKYDGDVFNPQRIIAAARSEEHSRLTRTGKILKLVE